MNGLISLFLLAAWAAPAGSPVPVPPRPASSADGWVVIPVEEYRALRTKAFPLDPEPGPPPVEWALSRIDVDLKVDNDSVAGEARLTVDVLKDGWVRLALPRTLKIQSARVDGRPVALVSEPGRDPFVLLSKPGRTVLTLDIATPLITVNGAESFTLPASGASVFRVLARIPRPAVDLAVVGGVMASKDETESETRVNVSVRPGENLSMRWRRRAEARKATLPPKFRSVVTEIVGLGEETAAATINATIEMTQGGTTTIGYAVPADFVVNQVSGALVGDWDFKPGVLSVTFLESLESSTSFIIQGEAKAPREGFVTIPVLRASGADRETGGVAVEVLGAGEIKSHKAAGLEPTDPSELGSVLAGRDSPSLSAFRFQPLAQGARTLSVDVARYTPQAVLLANIEEARYETLLTDEGKRLCRARYAIRNNQRAFLTVSLPQGAMLWSASVAGKPVRPGLTPTGALLLPLQKTRGGEETPAFQAEVIYFERSDAWLREGHATLALPSLDLPVSRTGVVLYHSPEFKLAVDRGSFRLSEFERPSSPAFNPVETFAVPEEIGRLDQPKDKKESRDQAFQGLVDSFNKVARVGRLAAALPVEVGVPEVGERTYLTSELTGEGSSPSISLTYAKGGKR